MYLPKYIWILPCVLILVTADHAGQSILDSTGSLSPNAVPMMGKKDAAPREVPSFTSGYLPPAFPQYIRGRPNKRRSSPSRTSWHLGKRHPTDLHTSSWLGSLFKPSTMEMAAGKRSATPNEWNSPWDNMLRSSQGFRFHEGGSDLLNRHLMYKRTSENVDQDTDEPDIDIDESIYAEYGGLMDDVSLVRSSSI